MSLWYEPRQKKPMPPCGTACADRRGGCHAACGKWAAYERERNRAYETIRKERRSMELNDRAQRLAAAPKKAHRRQTAYEEE